MDFNQLKSLCRAGSSSRYSAVIICHAVATAMAAVPVAVTVAASWRVAADGGGRLGEAAAESDAETSRHEGAMASSRNIWFISSESEFCVSSTNCPQFSRWQKSLQII